MNYRQNKHLSTTKYYRPLVILLLSAVAVFFTIQHYPLAENLLLYGALTGFLQILVLRLAGNYSLKYAGKGRLYKFLGVFFAPQPSASLGMLFTSMSGFLLLLLLVPVPAWNIYLINFLAFSYLGGSATALLAYELAGYKVGSVDIKYRIDPDRYDTFAGAVTGSVFLGTSFLDLPASGSAFNGLGPVILPLAFGLASVLLTYAGAMLSELRPRLNAGFLLPAGVAIAALLMFISAFLVQWLLPGNWVFEGYEYSAASVLGAMEVGIMAGLVSGSAVEVYRFLAKRYINYVLDSHSKRVYLNVVLRMLLNGIIASVPILVVAWALLSAYNMLGIYTVALALMCMVSNVGVSLLVRKNYLNLSQIPEISQAQRKKLVALAPDFRLLVAGFLRKARARVFA